MINEKVDQIIDEVYLNYSKNHFKIWEPGMDYESKESFINRCNTDPDFSEKWGLKIDVRTLTFDERFDLAIKYGYISSDAKKPTETEMFQGVNARDEFNSLMNDLVIGTDLPKKLITITYNNETIEVYE